MYYSEFTLEMVTSSRSKVIFNKFNVNFQYSSPSVNLKLLVWKWEKMSYRNLLHFDNKTLNIKHAL